MNYKQDKLLALERESPYNEQAWKLTLRYWAQSGTDPTQLEAYMLETFRHIRFVIEYLHNFGMTAE